MKSRVIQRSHSHEFQDIEISSEIAIGMKCRGLEQVAAEAGLLDFAGLVANRVLIHRTFTIVTGNCLFGRHE